MKIRLIIVCFILFTTFASSQTYICDAKDIKNRKMIIAFREYPKDATDVQIKIVDSLNSLLKSSIEKYWNFTEISKCLPLSEADKLVSEDKNYFYITIDSHFRTWTQRDYIHVIKANRVSVYTQAGIIAKAYLPNRGLQFVQSWQIAYSIIQLNKILQSLYDEELKSTMIFTLKDYAKKNGPNIIKKTLLIPKEYISPKLSIDEIKLAYPYDLDICDMEKVKIAILEKDPKYAVALAVPFSINEKLTDLLFIAGTEDGYIFGIFSFNLLKSAFLNDYELKEIASMVD